MKRWFNWIPAFAGMTEEVASRPHGPPWECRSVWVPTKDLGNQKNYSAARHHYSIFNVEGAEKTEKSIICWVTPFHFLCW